jgi:hypothetical protein
VTEDPIVVRLAAAFAEAVSEGDLVRAEQWAEAAWRRRTQVPEEKPSHA